MVFVTGKDCKGRDLAVEYNEKELIGSLLEIESSFWFHHWGVIVEVDGRNVYMIHLTNKHVVTRQLVADYAGNSLVRINNALDDEYTPYSAEEIVNRAKSKLGHYRYHEIETNCEHFANWCRYGKFVSKQSRRTLAAAPLTLPVLGWAKLFGCISPSSASS